MELDILEKKLVLVCKKPPYNLDISLLFVFLYSDLIFFLRLGMGYLFHG